MDITITLNCDNAAFDDDNGPAGQEIARILRQLASKCAHSSKWDLATAAEITLHDVNGNKVGQALITGDADMAEGGQ